MIDTFRKKLRSGILLAILGVGLLAIVITGFGTGGMGGLGGLSGGGQRAEAIVEIDGEDLTDVEVSRQLSLAFREYAQENRTADRARFFGEVFDPALDQIIDTRTVAAFARQLGMVIPQEMVDREIARQFDETTFRQYLEQAERTEREVRQELEQQLLIRMIAAPIGGRGRVPPAIARAYADLLLESRTGQIGAVPTALLARSISPSEQEVATFYQNNRQLFQLPERRVVRYALIGRDQLGDAVRVSDEEIAAHYQRNQATYGPVESRSLLIFTTQDEAMARRVADKVRGGTSFVEAARAEGFAPEDITFPNLRREQVVQQSSEEVANAVFSTAQGGLVGPTRTPTGFKVVRVEGSSRTPGRPLQAVRGEIVTALEQSKLAEALNARVDQIQERLDDGASLEELARDFGLQVQTSPALTSTGAAPNFQFPTETMRVVATAFELPANETAIEAIQENKQAALIEVTNIVPPAAPPLDQIRDQVRQRLVERTAVERGRTIAEGIVNRINGGMAPDQAYAQAGLTLPARETRTERRSTIERAGQAAPPPFRILFAIPEGRARMVAAPNNGGWIIVHHQRRTPGNASTDREGRVALTEQERRMTAATPLELVSQFARAVRGVISVERDEERINALRQRLVSGQ